MVIIETPLYPEQGRAIKGGGEIRRVRLKLSGGGKRGGARVIYFLVKDAKQIYMLVAYAKNVQSDLTDRQVKALKDLVKELK